MRLLQTKLSILKKYALSSHIIQMVIHKKLFTRTDFYLFLIENSFAECSTVSYVNTISIFWKQYMPN